MPSLVVDNGSGMLKAGVAGEDAPRFVLPSVIGMAKYKGLIESGYCRQIDTTFIPSDVISIMANYRSGNTHIGNIDIQSKEHMCLFDFKYPIEHGIIFNWDHMQMIYEHAVFANEFKMDPKGQNLLLTRRAFSSKQYKEKLMQLMFETFEVGKFYLTASGVLGLYSSGRTTGTVVDIGDGVTTVTPFYEGYALPHGALRCDIAGRDITQYLQQKLRLKHIDLPAQIVMDIKEKYGEIVSVEKKNDILEYELPDGNKIELHEERYNCGEILFKPWMMVPLFEEGHKKGFEYNHGMKGVHDMTWECIQKCDQDIRRDLRTNIVVNGGTTLFKGFVDRFYAEIQRLFPGDGETTKVIAPTERECGVWIGGSILASLSTFQEMWIKHEEYLEIGCSIIHRDFWRSQL
eukprot:448111_1